MACACAGNGNDSCPAEYFDNVGLDGQVCGGRGDRVHGRAAGRERLMTAAAQSRIVNGLRLAMSLSPSIFAIRERDRGLGGDSRLSYRRKDS